MCYIHLLDFVFVLQNLNGCITVNPERLAKGLVGGNFARLEVSCIKGDVNVSAQIVKI